MVSKLIGLFLVVRMLHASADSDEATKLVKAMAKAFVPTAAMARIGVTGGAPLPVGTAHSNVQTGDSWEPAVSKTLIDMEERSQETKVTYQRLRARIEKMPQADDQASFCSAASFGWLVGFIASFSLASVGVAAVRKLSGYAQHGSESTSGSQISLVPQRAGLVIASAARKAYVEVVFEDEDYFFVRKPPGMVCAGGDGDDAASFHEHVKAHAIEAYNYQPGLLHRLDKGCSGIMTYAKNKAAAAHYLRLQGERGAITKQYLAWVQGSPPKQAGRVEGGICKSSDLRTYVVRGKKSGKAVLTTYKVLQQSAHPTFGELSELSLLLFTGRKHQIRASCRKMGCTIVGDKLYGGKPHHTMLLHSHRVAFTGANSTVYDVSVTPPAAWAGFYPSSAADDAD